MKYSLALTLAMVPLLGAEAQHNALNFVTNVRHWSLGEMTQVAIEVSGEFQFHAGRLRDPERIYFDIPDTRPQFENRRMLSEEVDDALLKRIRVAENAPGITRVVLEVSSGVQSATLRLSKPRWLVAELTPSGTSPVPPAPGAASAQVAIEAPVAGRAEAPLPPLATTQPQEPARLEGPAQLQVPRRTEVPPQTEELTLIVGRGTVIECPEGLSRISTSSPETVDATAASDTEVLFHAKALGQATLVVWSKTGRRRMFQVTVEPNLEPLRKLLRETFPDEQMDLRAGRDSLALVGRASSQAVADRAMALITASVKGAVNNLQIAPAPAEPQILLKVRFAELNRSATTEFGLNLLSTGALRTIGSVSTEQFSPPGMADLTGGIQAPGSGTTAFRLSDLLNIFAFRPDLNLGALIRDLESRGLLEILAEPNLVAINGKPASFLAGGEFPLPVVQAGPNAGAVTVQFREYGIRLTFVPFVTTRHTIHLHVRPEVSTIDEANSVTVSGFRIPALSTRSVETDIELSEGQSFVIAGLLDQRVTQDLERMPGLANIPLLGQLFRSRAQTKAKTELVVVVTPEMASAVNGTVSLPSPPVRFLDQPKEPKKK